VLPHALHSQLGSSAQRKSRTAAQHYRSSASARTWHLTDRSSRCTIKRFKWYVIQASRCTYLSNCTHSSGRGTFEPLAALASARQTEGRLTVVRNGRQNTRSAGTSILPSNAAYSAAPEKKLPTCPRYPGHARGRRGASVRCVGQYYVTLFNLGLGHSSGQQWRQVN
jgi:hypothetical protein